jgi:hypothetical protein
MNEQNNIFILIDILLNNPLCVRFNEIATLFCIENVLRVYDCLHVSAPLFVE